MGKEKEVERSRDPIRSYLREGGKVRNMACDGLRAGSAWVGGWREDGCDTGQREGGGGYRLFT